MEKFAGLDENILILIAFSASKGFTMYGLRNGALLCVTSKEEIAKEFFYTNLHSKTRDLVFKWNKRCHESSY